MKIALRVLHAAAIVSNLQNRMLFLLRAWVKVDNRNANPDELARLVIDDQLPLSRLKSEENSLAVSRMRSWTSPERPRRGRYFNPCQLRCEVWRPLWGFEPRYRRKGDVLGRLDDGDKVEPAGFRTALL